MLNALIKFSLQNRLLVVAAAALVLVYGAFTAAQLPVDVLPDLNRPQVTIFLEANGMAPEEIENQVVTPVEIAMNGAPGVERVRSSSGVGIGLVFVEFDWSTDVYRARQLVSEKLQTVLLPEGIVPVMGPISSIMGQIMMIGITADSTPPSELRTLADFTIRRRLMSIKGISQVIPIGGERLQYQVLVSTQRLKQYNLSIDAIDQALRQSNQNSTGGFFDRYGSEVLIRNIARARSLDDLKNTVVANKDGLPVLLSDVAEVRFGAAVRRGAAGINGQPAVILTVEKQPGANTLELTAQVERAVAELQAALPGDVRLNPNIFQQKGFIVQALANVESALRDGFILVVIVLLLFLLNFRTTAITLTAIPVSLAITALVFQYFGISINTLTLGGFAIAIGELVDDAIVDVENVFRRLRENRLLEQPRPTLQVVYEASSEVRNSIVYATVIVILVFLPLFYLQGMEGRIFAPLGIAYITSIAASLLVSLTLTPALSSYLLKNAGAQQEQESRLVRWLKKQDQRILSWTLERPQPVVLVAGAMILASIAIVPFLGTEFLPAFNEGSFTVNLATPPGTSLEESDKIGRAAEKLILRVPDVAYASRRTGRAELDEHVEPPSNSEIEIELRAGARPRDSVLLDIRRELETLAGVSVNIGQPISHRLDHLLSGVRAQVAVKIFGPELLELRHQADAASRILAATPGIVDVQVEKQTLIPQLQIRVNRDALKRYGLQAGKVAADLEVFFNGKVVSQMVLEQQYFDILLRTTPAERTNLESIGNTLIDAPDGSMIPLHQIASIEYNPAANAIYHENTQRRIVISANVQGRDLGSAVQALQQTMAEKLELPAGYFLSYGGQFESQQSATRLIGLLSLFAVLGILLVLYHHFRSLLLVVQVMLNIPLALIGSVVAVLLSGGVFSVATLVGFITLTGIASRNGIMMLSHYIHLIEHEGETFSRQMIIRGSLERLVPVLMTALTAALALVPLVLDAGAPGKEILHPVAVVILGGLVSSTLLDILVTPAVFWLIGEKALKGYFENKNKQFSLE
ncbi:MAG: efflux RND transporter permease subunit [Saprospiraceae bacterium]|nr:efflux RND transporter permease subunit [Saprospiraceae bacterium]